MPFYTYHIANPTGTGGSHTTSIPASIVPGTSGEEYPIPSIFQHSN